MYRTIPQLLSDAAARDPDGLWIRADDVELTFAEAATAAGARAAALRAHGVRHGVDRAYNPGVPAHLAGDHICRCDCGADESIVQLGRVRRVARSDPPEADDHRPRVAV